MANIAPPSPKNQRIDIRATPREKRILEEAARVRGSNVSGFLLENGLAAAERELAGRRVFVLDDRQWEAFEAALDRPVERKPALDRLLSEPGLLD